MCMASASDQTRNTFWRLYNNTSAKLYAFCARRVTTRPVIGFMMKSLYENAFEELNDGSRVRLVDLYKWAYEFFKAQQPTKKVQRVSDGQVKRAPDGHATDIPRKPVERIHNFKDVYAIKTDSDSRVIRRDDVAEMFFTQLDFVDREALWLTFFEELDDADRAHVMNVPLAESSRRYFEALKRAREVVTMATSHLKGFRFAAYFGSVATLLKKVKQSEQLAMDEEIDTSLRKIFMDQYGAPATGTSDASAVKEASVPPMPPGVDVDPAVKASAAAVPAAPASDDVNFDDFEFDGAGLFGRVLRKLQGVVVVVVILAVGVFGYRYFFNKPDAKRLLSDARVKIEQTFNDSEKAHIADTALSFLVEKREFDGVSVDRRSDGIFVTIANHDGSKEYLYLRPYRASFDAKIQWQPKTYMKLVAFNQ